MAAAAKNCTAAPCWTTTSTSKTNVIYSTGAMMEDFEELRKMLKADGLSQDEIDLVIEELTGHFDDGRWDE